jgi:predicted nucleic acid-binding protein
MNAVSNTTPLRYLTAIRQEHLLAQLFEKVFVPTAVYDELTDPKTPEDVRTTVVSLPAWLEVRAVRETGAATFPVTLHRGEREAILLAEAIRADVLLIDEQIGRIIAQSRNIPPSGTLGVLERADSMGLVSDFPQVLKELNTSGFFIAEALELQPCGVTTHAKKRNNRTENSGERGRARTFDKRIKSPLLYQLSYAPTS